jgi:hypothetical protein
MRPWGRHTRDLARTPDRRGEELIHPVDPNTAAFGRQSLTPYADVGVEQEPPIRFGGRTTFSATFKDLQYVGVMRLNERQVTMDLVQRHGQDRALRRAKRPAPSTIPRSPVSPGRGARTPLGAPEGWRL